MKSFIILFAFIGISVVQGANRTNFLEIGQFECEGRDGLNYTYVAEWSDDETCSDAFYLNAGNDYLIASQKNDQKLINVLSILVDKDNEAGAYYQYEVLYIATSGNLEGKFLYFKEIGLLEAYLKKCSSVLGYSYISIKSHILLIADKLDPNIFLNPTGAFQPFKKSATTICQGKSIIV